MISTNRNLSVYILNILDLRTYNPGILHDVTDRVLSGIPQAMISRGITYEQIADMIYEQVEELHRGY